MGLAVARGQRRRNQRAVVERGFFIGDQPSGARLFAVRRGAGRIGRGYINPVVTFQSLAVVVDLTAELEGFLSVRAGGKQEGGAGDDQRGAHFRGQGWWDRAGTIEKPRRQGGGGRGRVGERRVADIAAAPACRSQVATAAVVRLGTTSFAMRICTVSPRWFRVSLRT